MKTLRFAPPPGHLAIILPSVFFAFCVAPATSNWSPPPTDEVGAPAEIDSQSHIQFAEAMTFAALPDNVNTRPLFSPSRRESKEQPPSTNVNEAPKDLPVDTVQAVNDIATLNLVFKGFVATETGPHALIQWHPEADEEWVNVGFERDGWKLEAIEKNALLLRNGNEERSVTMFGDQWQTDESVGQ